MEELHWVGKCGDSNGLEMIIFTGFDRLMAVLCQSNSVRDVLAFPKSYQGKDLLTGAPSTIDKQTLGTYHLAPIHKK